MVTGIESADPLRGGKHTFWEGGVRVVCWLASPLLPAGRRGTVWTGMAHSSDWYMTLVEGIAGGSVDRQHTGPTQPDGFNLWPALLSGGSSPRTEVCRLSLSAARVRVCWL